MDDQPIFLSNSERHFLWLIIQTRGILVRRVPKTIVLVLAEQIFGRRFRHAIKNLENRGHLVNTADGYGVAHGLLENPRVRVSGCEIELIGATQLRRLCELYNQQPDHELKTSDLYEEDPEECRHAKKSGAIPCRSSTEKDDQKARSVVHWKDVVWQVAAELRNFVSLMKDEKFTFWIIGRVALGLGYESIDTRKLIGHMIEEMVLATNQDKTWRLLDSRASGTRSSTPAGKLPNDQRLAILQEIRLRSPP